MPILATIRLLLVFDHDNFDTVGRLNVAAELHFVSENAEVMNDEHDTAVFLEIGFDIGVSRRVPTCRCSLTTMMAVSRGDEVRDELLAGKLHPTYLTVVIDPPRTTTNKEFLQRVLYVPFPLWLGVHGTTEIGLEEAATSTTRFSFGFTLFSRYAFRSRRLARVLRSIAAVAKWCCRALEP